MMSEMPDIDVGSPPNSDDMNEEYDWWAKAQEALREHWDDGLGVWVCENSHMACRYEIKEVEKSESREKMNPDGSLSMETHTWTEEEKVPVGEKKVTTGFYLEVTVTNEKEKDAACALAHSAGLNVRDISGSGVSSRTHRLEA